MLAQSTPIQRALRLTCVLGFSWSFLDVYGTLSKSLSRKRTSTMCPRATSSARTRTHSCACVQITWHRTTFLYVVGFFATCYDFHDQGRHTFLHGHFHDTVKVTNACREDVKLTYIVSFHDTTSVVDCGASPAGESSPVRLMEPMLTHRH